MSEPKTPWGSEVDKVWGSPTLSLPLVLAPGMCMGAAGVGHSWTLASFMCVPSITLPVPHLLPGGHSRASSESNCRLYHCPHVPFLTVHSCHSGICILT